MLPSPLPSAYFTLELINLRVNYEGAGRIAGSCGACLLREGADPVSPEALAPASDAQQDRSDRHPQKKETP
jgi:hypothetical protein